MFTKAPTIEAYTNVLLAVLTACFSEHRPNNSALASTQFELTRALKTYSVKCSVSLTYFCPHF